MIIIIHSRKALLFHGNEPWVKKEGSQDLDVTIEAMMGEDI